MCLLVNGFLYATWVIHLTSCSLSSTASNGRIFNILAIAFKSLHEFAPHLLCTLGFFGKVHHDTAVQVVGEDTLGVLCPVLAT